MIRPFKNNFYLNIIKNNRRYENEKQQRVVSLSGGRRINRLGRPRAIDEEKRNLILELYWNNNIGLRKIADFVGVSSMTVWREVNWVRI